MPKQDTYPILATADASTFATGYRTDPTTGALTTVRVPMGFLYGGKWTMGVGAPTTNGVGTGDAYLNVQNGDVYQWDETALSWGTPKGTLINGTYQVPVWIYGKPLGNEILYSLEAPNTFVANQGMTDSVAGADTAATAQSVFSIQQNGVEFATVTFAAGATVGTIACAQQVIFLTGDVMNVVAPATPDATLSNVRMTLAFTRPSGAAESDIISSGQAANSATAAASSATAAAASATTAGASAVTAQNWAAQATGTVDGTSYSAKYYANSISGAAATATTQAAAAAASATAAGASETNAGNSATAASGSATAAGTSASSASTSASLAMNWASQAAGTVNGTSYKSAMLYAQDAAASASAAASSAASFPTSGRYLGTRVLTGSGTYTPTAGTTSIEVELQGAGAGSAGLLANTASQASVASAGATGGYVRHRYTSGFSGLAYAVGAPGAAGASGGGAGGSGGTTTFGSLTAGGAQGGTTFQSTSVGAGPVGVAGSASGGNILNLPGQLASPSFFSIPAGLVIAAPANPSVVFGMQYGWGGSGVGSGGSSGALPGLAGGPGIILVHEFS